MAEWQKMETAPRDGTNVIATIRGLTKTLSVVVTSSRSARPMSMMATSKRARAGFMLASIR